MVSRDGISPSFEAQMTLTDRLGPVFWVVETPKGPFRRSNQESAAALATVIERYDNIEIESRRHNIVPTKVAVDGKPAIVAYLRGVHSLSKEEIGEELGVEPSTVQKYLSRFMPD